MTKQTILANKALDILREFVADVNAIGRKQVGHEWPDLSITFNKAEALLADANTGKYGLPHGCRFLTGRDGTAL